MKKMFTVSLLFMVAACSQQTEPAKSTNLSSYPSVNTASAEVLASPLILSGTGFVEATEVLNVRSEVSAKVKWVSPDLTEGAFVKKDAPLVRLEDDIYRSNFNQAKAAVINAKVALSTAEEQKERLNTLNQTDASSDRAKQVSNRNFNNAKAQLKAAQANLILAQEQLDDTQITSPFNAQVLTETVTLGSLVDPTQNIATLIATDSAEISVGIAQAQANLILEAMNGTSSDKITVNLEKEGTALKTLAQLGKVEPEIDAQTRTVNFRILLPEALTKTSITSIFINDFVTVNFVLPALSTFYTSKLGVVRKENFVWSIDENNSLRKHTVQPLRRNGNRVIFQSDEHLNGKQLLFTQLTNEQENMKVSPLNTMQDLN